MNSADKMNESEKKFLNSGEISLDPFAVDIFGTKSVVKESNLSEEIIPIKSAIQPLKKSDWSNKLPQLTNQEVEFSYSLQNIPEGFSASVFEKITDAISRYTFRKPEDVIFSIISIAEINLGEAINKISKSPQVLINLTAKPSNSNAVIALDTEFATSIIDLILGGKGSEIFRPKGLSTIEKSILQFLVLNILKEVNRFLGNPLLSLQSISNENKINYTPSERGIEIVASLELEEFSGIISLTAPRYFLQNLEKNQNPLLAKKIRRKTLTHLEKFVPKFDLRLQVGSTTLDAESLLFLEPNDIVLFEKSDIFLQSESFRDKVNIFIGNGENFSFKGKVLDSEDSKLLNFKIEEILSEETKRKFTFAKFKMDEKDTEITVEKTELEANEEEISASLENLQVRIRVEIAGNKISLRELQNLRSGQIIALGCRPTDPVRLYADNNDEPVAIGELVEIEGQLGVKLTKVFI